MGFIPLGYVLIFPLLFSSFLLSSFHPKKMLYIRIYEKKCFLVVLLHDSPTIVWLVCLSGCFCSLIWTLHMAVKFAIP